MSMRIFACILCCVAMSFVPAAGQYRSSDIPENLSKDAEAVVRESSVRFNYDSPSSVSMQVSQAVTIMKNEGSSYGNFRINTDDRKKLRNFSGTVYDDKGNIIRKIKKGDLKFTEYSSGLVADGRMYYYDLNVAKGPYTVLYEYDMTFRNGLFGLPFFRPVPGHSTGVQKAEYILTIPEDLAYNVKMVNCNIEPQKESVKGGRVKIRYSIENIPPVPRERFMAPSDGMYPLVAIAPHRFNYDGYSGNMENWEEYGKWQWNLLQGRDELPEELKRRVRELTAGAADDREKVKILYDYLGEQTRYVSIQLGIGGWQPMKATDVYRNKFGDCKALTNYLMAMLRECGIESYYTEINSSRTSKRIWKDFPNALQTNHVILMVPLEEETLWLECTNPEVPFGYIHSNIAGNDALVCRDGTMQFVTLPDYPDSLNRTVKKIQVTLDADRSARMDFSSVFSGHDFEDIWGFSKLDARQQANKASKLVELPTGGIGTIRYEENKSEMPYATLDFDIEAMHFGSPAGGRIILPVNMVSYIPSRLPRTRNTDIYIRQGCLAADTVVYRIPDNYTVESVPDDLIVDNEFGRYTSHSRTEGQTVTLVHSFLLRRGMHPKSEYEGLRSLYEAVISDMKRTVTIKPSEQ